MGIHPLAVKVTNSDFDINKHMDTLKFICSKVLTLCLFCTHLNFPILSENIIRKIPGENSIGIIKVADICQYYQSQIPWIIKCMTKIGFQFPFIRCITIIYGGHAMH